MGVRRESVELTLDDRFTKQMGAVIAITALAEREFNKLDGAGRRGAGGVNEAERSVVGFERTTRSATPTIDKLSGRLELLAHTAMALGPSLIPIGAVAIPAVTTLGSGLGFAAAGAGTLELAFHNLAPALTAFNKASMEPTTANIAAAQLAMDKLSPSAQRFVLTLHAMGPEFVKMQQAAGSGLFPGLTSGMDALMKDGPIARSVLHSLGSELGILADDAGHALASDQWRPFLRFIGTEGPRELDVFGHATGDVLHGLAQLWMALTPLNGQVDSGILAVAQDFDRWATSLDKTKGFQDFMEYVRTNGPRVQALLGDTARLFTDIVQAAAPLGGPTLQALDLIVKALDALASSPLGTPLLALAQLNSVLKLTSSGLGAVGVNADLGLRSKITGGAKAATASLLTVTTASDRAKLSTAALSQVEDERAAANRAALVKGAAVAAGVALAASGAADAMGLQNTTMLATAGMVAGPWGAAVGGAVGLAMDWKASLDADKASVDGLKTSVAGFAASGDIMGLDKMAAGAGQVNSALAGNSIFGDKIAAQTAIPINAFDTLSLGINKFKAGLTGNDSPVTKLSDLQAIATRMQPAMAKLGITFDDMLSMDPVNLGRVVDHLVRITAASESVAGKTNAVTHAFAAMSDQTKTATDRATALTTALDALIDPMLNLGNAHDAFSQGLNDIAQQLSKTSKALVGNSDAAIQNRQAIRGQVTNLKSWIEAQANANVPAKIMLANLKAGRQAIIDQGRAAGLNAGQIQHMLDVMHLTPKFIKTAIQLSGTSEAENALQNLTRDRVIHIHAQLDHLGNFDTTGTGGHVATGSADGGVVPKTGKPYADRHLYLLADGERIISNRHGQADRYAGLLSAINANHRLADGGTTGGVTSASPLSGDNGVTPALRGMRHELEASKKAISDEKAARDSLVQKEQSLIQAVQGAFRSDIFASTTGVWGAGGGFNPNGALQSDISGARQFNRLLHQLDGRGVSGGALAAIAQTGSVQDAQMLAAESNRQLREYGRLFRQRQRLSHSVGQYAGDAVYGDRIAVLDRELRADKAHQKVVEHRLHQIEKAAKKNAAETAKALNGTAGNAGRKVKRT